MDKIMSSKNSDYTGSQGFTLVELLVSIVILMVGMLGMFQAINLALQHNIENQLRQKAVGVAEEQLNELKGRAFSNITGNTRGFSPVASGAAFKNISIQRQIDNLAASDSHTKRISIRVWWNYRGRQFEHQTVSGIGSKELSSGL